MRRRTRRRSASAAVAVASLAAHLVVLGLASWLLGRKAPPVEAPVLNVRLVTLAPRPPLKSTEPADIRPPRPAPAAAHRTAPPPPGVTPLPVAPVPADPGADVAQVLRSRLGCRPGDHARQTSEERQRCAAILAGVGAARDGEGPQLDLSRQGRIGKGPKFDLSTPPKNGCKVRAAGDQGPFGKDGARAGLACAWSF